MIIFNGKVISIGELVKEFIDEGILVLFGLNAPPELAEFSLIHDNEKVEASVEDGDALYIDGKCYKILSVGTVANKNLENLGHLVIKFNGLEKARLPGDVNVEKKKIPEICVGTIIQIKTTRM